MNYKSENFAFSILVRELPQRFDIYELIDHFIDLPNNPDDELGFMTKDEDPQFMPCTYPETLEEFAKCYSKLINTNYPIEIHKKGLDLYYFHSGRDDGRGRKEFMDISFDLGNNEIKQKIASLPNLHNFPEDFVVYNEPSNYRFIIESNFSKEIYKIINRLDSTTAKKHSTLSLRH